MKIINKSFVTNFISVVVLCVGIFWNDIVEDASSDILLLGEFIKTAGLFALSGAITNWLAIHMLFEKVPLLYGSGVIPNNFDAFTHTIREMMLNNFFNEENFAVLTDEMTHPDSGSFISADKIFEHVDENELFDSLVSVVEESNFGGMLKMFGGSKVLVQLRDPFILKIKSKVESMISSIDFVSMIDVHNSYEGLRPKIEKLIDTRLEQLSPSHVKEMVAEMIRMHLGWLVVWGGVFGALIGIVSIVLKIFF